MARGTSSGSRSKSKGAAAVKGSFVTDYFNNLLRMPLPSDEKDQEVADAEKEAAQSAVPAAVPCAIEGCKRKSKLNCCNRCCFQCCMESNSEKNCIGHSTDRAKRAEEDRYIDIAEGNYKQRSRNNKFNHFEERFDGFNQTVVVFCLKDFLRTRQFSEEIFLTYEREDRQRKLLLRRQQHREHLEDTSSGGGGDKRAPIEAEGKKYVNVGLERLMSHKKEVVDRGHSPWLEKFQKVNVRTVGGSSSAVRKMQIV